MQSTFGLIKDFKIYYLNMFSRILILEGSNATNFPETTDHTNKDFGWSQLNFSLQHLKIILNRADDFQGGFNDIA